MSRRYALYFAPEETSDLYLFGKTILGRTPDKARADNASSSFNDQARWQSFTKQPAYYGFHATLKAPFELKPGFTEEQLLDEVDAFTQRQTPISLPTLAPRRLSGFFALTLEKQPQALTDFAMSCVEHFDYFRGPLSAEDMQRRLERPLTERQTELLTLFGYPYVGEEFRFHMTLSGALPAQANDFEQWVEAQYKQIIHKDPVLDKVSIYTQPDRLSAFTELSTYPMKHQM